MLGLRFGIPGLDRLLEKETGEYGVWQEYGTTTMCIIGVDGTGKSVYGLHLASRYRADCHMAGSAARVLYVSTDLTDGVAQRIWCNFALNRPNVRKVPFDDTSKRAPDLKVSLAPRRLLAPEDASDGLKSLSARLNDPVGGQGDSGGCNRVEVDFVDLTSSTAGDDWGFVNRALALLRTPPAGEPRHLLLVDSVDGMETLVGERDAFGEPSSRRSRIAQIIRSATRKCHVVFMVQEPNEGERVPEEFVTDVVVRLRGVVYGGYIRRTVEIEKARGQSHVRGLHPFVIRSGRGSTTGEQENADDPAVKPLRDDNSRKGLARAKGQSYVHVFHSLHHLARSIMEDPAGARPLPPPRSYAAFGVPYLDDMLAGTGMSVEQHEGKDTRGLPCSTVTALIGDAGTPKSRLGAAFLSRCFASYAEELSELITTHAAVPPPPEADAAVSGWLHELAQKPKVSLSKDPTGKKLVKWFLNRKLKDSKFEGVAVLITTQDLHDSKLAQDFERWLSRNVPSVAALPEVGQRLYSEVLRAHMRKRTVCRRLEIHDASSPLLFHVVRRAVERAQEILFNGRVSSQPKDRFEQSWRIRLVVDDLSTLKDTYLEVRQDPLFLPFLLFHLGREGVTTLIIDTHPGRPDLMPTEAFDSELRALVRNHLYTWHVPFFGENRVAIAAIPPFSRDLPPVVRELRWEFDPEGDPLVVDPNFELYGGLEEGKPQPVPVMVRLYAETKAFEEYIDQENLLFQQLFTPVPRNGETAANVIVGLPAAQYDTLRDFCNLQGDTRLDHTLVFQIDEFWAIRNNEALRNQVFYLGAKTATRQGSPDRTVDPFRVFQRTANDSKQRGEPRRRHEYFALNGYLLDHPSSARNDHSERHSSSDTGAGPFWTVDRVPFMWDFGFLLCKEQAWRAAFERPLPLLNKNYGAKVTVGTVWNALPKALKGPPAGEEWGSTNRQANGPHPGSWRAFLEACQEVAGAETARIGSPGTAFDVALLAAESFSCLLMEIWASEIYQAQTHPKQIIEQVSKRNWQVPRGLGLVDWLSEAGTLERIYANAAAAEQRPLLSKYSLELYKSWLLLVDVLNLSGFVDSDGSFELKVKKADPSAVAARHWYKTACEFVGTSSQTEPMVVARLPGHFSVRGDWFLAVAGGSRSGRAADRVLDLLSSRRANVTRLQLGLGLPTRDVALKERYGQLRTKLSSLTQGERASVSYEDLLSIGDREGRNGDPFFWLWRSQLGNYDRQARIWRKWINRMLAWWRSLRLDQGARWRNGFEVYDALTQEDFREVKALDSWREFPRLCDFLIIALKEASALDDPYPTERRRPGSERPPDLAQAVRA